MVTVYTQDFSQCDDYIAWKAQKKMFNELSVTSTTSISAASSQ